MNYQQNSNSITYLYRELDKKNIQIKEYKTRISNLIDEKTYLLQQIDKLKLLNNQLRVTSEQEYNQNFNIYKEREAALANTIQFLQNENENLRKNLSQKEDIEKNFNNTYNYKILIANNEIENLKNMNNEKEIIINSIQNFLNNILSKADNIGNLSFDLKEIDYNLFINNLKTLENSIISKLSGLSIIPSKKPQKINNNNVKNNKILVRHNNSLNKPANKYKNKNNKNRKLTKSSTNLFRGTIKKTNKFLKTNVEKNNNFEKFNEQNGARTPSREGNNIYDYIDDDISNYLRSINDQSLYPQIIDN